MIEAQHLYEVEGLTEDMLADYFGRPIDVTGWTQRVGSSVQAHVVAETHKHEVSSLRFKVTKLMEAIPEDMPIGEKVPLVKTLVDSTVKLVELERRVYGVKDETGESALVNALRELGHLLD